ncbi:hypothetical protein FBALC1_03432 [Flavobacteriales bacterium ALC-1]|nr:hypothetical protein FBALC1_03432 [Flavobacteriales bacterium ALC-1]
MKFNYALGNLALILTLLLFSCSGDSGGDGDDDGGGNELTSIQITASVTSDVYVGDQITFTILGNNGQLLNSLADLKVNGTSVNGNAYTTTSAGVHEFVASYSNVTSNAVQITVEEVPVRFARNVLIEDYTGTWCGYCPRVSYGIELVEAQTDQAVVVAIHRPSSNTSSGYYDPYNYADAATLENMINLGGYPTAMLNRTTEWTYPEPSNVSQITDLSEDHGDLGIALSPTVSGGDISIDINVEFGDLFNSSNAKLVVYVLEDGLIYDQTNYTSYFGGASTLSNFVHNHVLRAALTSLTGDDIPSSEAVVGNVYSTTITTAMPSSISNTSNINVVVFVVDGATNAVLNARAADIGDTQDFEEIE